MISGHVKNKHALQERLITDAEKQCFEGPEEKRNCDPLNELTKKFIIRKVKVKSFTGSSVTVSPVSPESPNEEK